MELAPGTRCPLCGNLARSFRKPLLERFWEKVPKNLPDDVCWEWEGCLNEKGYGNIRLGGRDSKRPKAHRVSWVFYHGRPIPDGMMVMHLCDNPPCVNPVHLRLGTAADNTQHMLAKGRQPKRTGSRLTDEQVLEIVQLDKQCVPQRTIANHIGISRRTVRGILGGKRWSWLTGIKPAP